MPKKWKEKPVKVIRKNLKEIPKPRKLLINPEICDKRMNPIMKKEVFQS